MKQALQARQAQTLNLTPQLLQTIRLLQLTAPQLEMELRQALERNPLLESAIAEDEAEDDAPAADAAAQDCAAWDELPEPMFLSGGGHAGSGDEDATARIAAGESSDWRQRLLALLALQWRPHALAMASFWLDHCDDRGYLEHDLQALGQRGAAELGVAADELEVARQRLLHGEWPGVAAADPAECLRAQLALQPDNRARALAARILADHLDLLAAHDAAALARALGAGEDDTHAAIALVLSLRPHPVEAIAADSGHIVPDVVAWHAGGTWRVALNDAALPRVRIAPHCEQALTDAPGQHAALRGLLEEARWLVRGVAMRNETLLRTTQVLVERQRAFLDRGEEAIAPLTLKEVADAIGMHESTVSRITTGKYLQTPRGTFELKRLFAVRLEGANVGATAVKAMVRRLIETEPANAPLADDVIAGLLARQGVRIARRTVAKYRDQLHIPSALARRARPAVATA